MKNALLFLAILFFVTIKAQNDSLYTLQANNVAAGVTNKNSYFWDLETPKYEFPKGGGITAIYASALWLTGLDPANNLKGSWNTYPQMGDRFTTGPVSDYPFPYSFALKYRKIFPITRNQIVYHQQHYSQAGYVPISNIANWPAHGDTTYNEAFHLAPFIDLNGNGQYEPLLGDYPDVPGDDNAFLIVNDKSPQGNMPMKAEIHMLFYQMNCPYNSAINNTTFLSTKIFNRSTTTYHDVLFSSFDDFDLGCSENDRIGFDTLRNMSYVYNGTMPDFGSACLTGANGYINNRVSLGNVFLNNKLFSGINIHRAGTLNQTDPTVIPEARFFQLGKKNDGSPFLNSIGDTVKILYPGNPNDPTGWSEYTGNIAPGDKRTLSTIKIDTFYPNQMINIDMAYVSTIDSSLNNIQIVNKLMEDVDSVKAFYDQHRSCTWGNVGIDDNKVFAATLFPNPAQNQLTVSTIQQFNSLSVLDISGRQLLTFSFEDTLNKTIALNDLSTGVYLLQISSKGKKQTIRFVKE